MAQILLPTGAAPATPAVGYVASYVKADKKLYIKDDDGVETAVGGGSGTVTTVSVVTANGLSGTVANPTTTPAITLTLDAATASVPGSMSSTDKTKLDAATAANTASTLVFRDGSGNFAAGIITAALTGTASGNLVSGGALGTPSGGSAANLTSFPTLNQNTTGTAANITGNLAVANLNSGTSASASTFWRGDGTWVAAGGNDANNNYSADNLIQGYATTPTAGGTTTLDVNSNGTQFFTTGSPATQTVTLPVTSTLALGQTFRIVNNSTGIVTVNSSGANAVVAMAAGTGVWLTCILLSGTDAASWNFRDAVSAGRNRAAPNDGANRPVHHLSAIGSETDIDVALVPKGTGGVASSVADNGTGGGNKRGTNSVDWQSLRDVNTKVASGSTSTIGGGRSNTANNTDCTIAGGFSNTASNVQATICGGISNTSSGNASTVGGGNTNNAGSTNSTICGGQNNIVTTAQGGTVGGGEENTASGHRSTVPGGMQASTFGVAGKYSYSSGQFGAKGDCQRGSLTLRVATSSTTPAVLTSNTAGADTGNQLVLQNNQAMTVRGQITCKRSATVEMAAFEFTCAIVRGTTASTTAIVGTPVVTIVANTISGLTSFAVADITADTTNGSLKITVTGTSASLRWLCVCTTAEVILA